MKTKRTASKAPTKKTAAAAAKKTLAAPFKLRRILVPVDFSDHSRNALRYAVRFASQFGAELVLVHVIEQMVYPGDWMYPPLATGDFAVERQGKVVAELREIGAATGLKFRTVVKLGRAWQAVVEIAAAQKADLLVIATHGYTGLKHVLLGSVAEKIVRHAPCPVLTVRPEERDFA